MSEGGKVDSNFIVRKLDRLQSDFNTQRDDLLVLTTMVMRQDNTMAAMLTELRAVHSQQSRMGNRVRKLEDAVFDEEGTP